MTHSRIFASLRAAAAALLAGSTLVACSGTKSDTAATEASTSESPKIVATTQVWADVASSVTGEDVEAVITGANVDPHHYEATAADIAKLQEADLVIANGGAYDAGLYDAVDESKLIHAIPLLDGAHTHDQDHGDHDDHAGHDHSHDLNIDEIEHAWFVPEKVSEVAKEIEQRAGGSASEVTKRMDAVSERLGQLEHVHLAMTEPIATGLLYGTELHDVTPEQYARSTLNHTDPSIDAIAAFIEVIEQGSLDFLVVNSQSTNSATQRLIDAANENNVPIIEITETPPAGTNFLDYIEEVTDAIERVVATAEPKDHAA